MRCVTGQHECAAFYLLSLPTQLPGVPQRAPQLRHNAISRRDGRTREADASARAAAFASSRHVSVEFVSTSNSHHDFRLLLCCLVVWLFACAG